MARYLETRRAAAGLTMPEVAKRLGGPWVNNYAQYEKGRSMPGIKQLQKLVAAIPSKEVDKILMGYGFPAYLRGVPLVAGLSKF